MKLSFVLFLVLELFGGAVGRAEPNVVAIEWHSDGGEIQSRLLSEATAVQIGRPRAPQEVRASVRALHALGLASQIEVYQEGRDRGIAVIFVLRSPARIASLQIEGELGLDEKLLWPSVEPRAGDPLVESELLRSVFLLQDLYRDEGYLEARVVLKVEKNLEGSFDCVLEVDAGRRSTLAEIVIQGLGDEGLSARASEALGSQSGKPFRQRIFRQDRDDLWGFLVEEGYRKARVGEASEEFRHEEAKVDLLFEVELGPLFEIEIVGADAKKLERKGLLPFLGEAGYDEALVVQAVSRIKRYFQGQGHYRVDVSWEEERSGPRTKIRIRVDKGRLFRLSRVDLSGNLEVSSELLLELMSTAPWRRLVPGSGRLVDGVLDADLENLRSHYRLEGFHEVRVGSAHVEEEAEGLLTLEVPIEEGPRQRVVSVEVHGVDASERQELLDRFPLRAGGAFHSSLLEGSRAITQQFFSQLGHSSARIETQVDWDEGNEFVDVVFEVARGPVARIRRIVIRGNRRTRPEVVQRRLGISVGDRISPEGLLEAQRSLYRLGLFSRVGLDLTSLPDDPLGRDVRVRLEEAPARRLTYGFGYNSEEGFGGLLGWSHANLWGRAHALSADIRLTSSDNRRFRLLYRQPVKGEKLVPLHYMIFRFDEDRPGYEVRSSGGQFSASWISRRWRWGGRFDYRLVEPFNITVPINEIERELQESRIASWNTFLQFDGRDRPVDTRSGPTTRLEVELARPMLSATADYFKFFSEQTFHFDFRHVGVLAVSFRLGAIEPLGDEMEGEIPDLPTASIPIVKRFFGGGRTTHRAYERDLLGIVGRTLNEEGEPTGGNGLFLANLDFRFPLAGPVEGLAFFDAGNIWADWRDLDRRDIRFGAGLGVRYLSPIGPLRLEAGWKLDREPGEAQSAVFLSFGDPF